MRFPSSFRWIGLALGGTSWVLVTATDAWADEPRGSREPHVLADSASDLTQVVDAFDDFDDFDLHVSLTLQQSMRRAPIYRETSIAQPGLTTGGYVSSGLNVANYQETTNRLIPALDIGLYRDLALRVRLPIILAHQRQLVDRGGSSRAGLSGADAAETPPAFAGLPGEQLFSLPFESPTRSGIEYLAVGLDYGLLNQHRSPALPTWVVGIEGRFSVTEPMRACTTTPGQTVTPSGRTVQQQNCAHPGDVNRDGVVDTSVAPGGAAPVDSSFTGRRSSGVSRGTTGIEVHSYLSKRMRYLEPYAGVSGLMEFPTANSDFGTSGLSNSGPNRPPLRASMVVGTAFIPWEVRENFQRISFDLRARTTYVSTGRDYSELFDALGSSQAASLRSAASNSNERVYSTGLTEVQGHAQLELSSQFTWQAGEYVKFDVGGAWQITQGHLITYDQPDHPNHRPVINDPGSRFKVGTSHGIHGWVRASVMF